MQIETKIDNNVENERGMTSIWTVSSLGEGL